MSAPPDEWAGFLVQYTAVMIQKIWTLKPEIPGGLLEGYAHPTFRQLLYNRGITTEAEAVALLHPQYQGLLDPFIFIDMKKAVQRTWEGIQKGEKIAVYGDYDADAVTANAVLQHTFRYLGVELASYIPDRFTEGYGLNLGAFEKLKAAGVTLVITVDCGTNSCDVADYCKENGIDLIITDHHEITGQTPDSFALINPKNPADVYPDHQITGVGVAFKFVCALLSEELKVSKQREVLGEKYIPGWEKWLLDLVSIGTVADCHSLMGENRILVGFGLKVLHKTKWLGLRALMVAAGVDPLVEPPTTYTLGFALAPRINAAGRLEHANVALQLLASRDHAESEILAQRLNDINIRRQEQTLRIVSEAKEQAAFFADRKIILVANPEWTKGVVGLAAGRLAENFGKPAIVLEKGEEESTGSARSVGTFDIVAALKFAEDILVKFGGHKQAAGLTVKTKDINALYARLLEFADSLPEENKVELEIEAEMQPEDISLDFFDLLALLEPFGFGNPRPKFLLAAAELVKVKEVGKEGGHLQIEVLLQGKSVQGIGFNLGFMVRQFAPGDKVDIVAELMADTWQGIRRVKMRLVDMRMNDKRTS